MSPRDGGNGPHGEAKAVHQSFQDPGNIQKSLWRRILARRCVLLCCGMHIVPITG